MPRSEAEREYLERLEAKAEFCLVTGVQPSEYDAMTDDEVEAFAEAYERLHKDR